MGRKPIGAAAMSGSERTRRWLERKLAVASTGAAAPVQDADKRQLDRDFEARVQHEVERRLAAQAAKAATASPAQAETKLSKTAEEREQPRSRGRASLKHEFEDCVVKRHKEVDRLRIGGRTCTCGRRCPPVSEKGVMTKAEYRQAPHGAAPDRTVTDADLRHLLALVLEHKDVLIRPPVRRFPPRRERRPTNT